MYQRLPAVPNIQLLLILLVISPMNFSFIFFSWNIHFLDSLAARCKMKTHLSTAIWNDTMLKLCLVALKEGSPSPFFFFFMWLECEHVSRSWNSHFAIRSESFVMRMAKEKDKRILNLLTSWNHLYYLYSDCYMKKKIISHLFKTLLFQVFATVPIYFPLKTPVFKDLACLSIKSSSYSHKHGRVVFYDLK